MTVMRVFIAIDIPIAIQQNLSAVLARLNKPETAAVRWVPAQNIHLTLKFLGDVSPTNVDLLKKILHTTVARHRSFEIRVAGLGAFPSPRRPRVIWVGVEAPPGLQSLYHSIETETVRLGYAPEERPFSPHLTLGRVTHNASSDEVRKVADILPTVQVGELGCAVVDHVCLFRSDLQPGGAVYTTLFSTPLGG